MNASNPIRILENIALQNRENKNNEPNTGNAEENIDDDASVTNSNSNSKTKQNLIEVVKVVPLPSVTPNWKRQEKFKLNTFKDDKTEENPYHGRVRKQRSVDDSRTHRRRLEESTKYRKRQYSEESDTHHVSRRKRHRKRKRSPASSVRSHSSGDIDRCTHVHLKHLTEDRKSDTDGYSDNIIENYVSPVERMMMRIDEQLAKHSANFISRNKDVKF